VCDIRFNDYFLSLKTILDGWMLIRWFGLVGWIILWIDFLDGKKPQNFLSLSPITSQSSLVSFLLKS
jgi:hypothetical protein